MLVFSTGSLLSGILFCQKHPSARRQALSRTEQDTLQNLWVGESLEILEMHYIYLKASVVVAANMA